MKGIYIVWRGSQVGTTVQEIFTVCLYGQAVKLIIALQAKLQAVWFRIFQKRIAKC